MIKRSHLPEMGLHLPKANRNNWQVRPRFELSMPPLCPTLPAHLPVYTVQISRKLLTLTEYYFRQAPFLSESSVSSTIIKGLRVNHMSRKTTTEWEKIFADYISGQIVFRLCEELLQLKNKKTTKKQEKLGVNISPKMLYTWRDAQHHSH